MESTNEFVERLVRSQLLAPQQLIQLTELVGTMSARDLATKLVRSRTLTRWQAEQLLFGRDAFQLGDYVLRRRIGGGATGSVYEAVHFQTGQRRALKVLAKEFASDVSYLERFRREVSFLGELDHPAVIRCFSSKRIGETEFLVMEFVNGPDLRERLDSQRTIAPTLASKMIEFVASGLQHVFENGLVHRDIKPSNLIVFTDPETRRPSLKIVDFGIALHVLSDAGTTSATGSAMGSLDYMAPEQFETGARVDIRADIFSLGATLFHMLSGRTLTTATRTPEKLSERLATRPPSVHSVAPNCPKALAAVVDRCLEIDPDRRYGTPQAVAEALKAARKGNASDAFPSQRSVITVSNHSPESEDSLEFSDESASDLDELLPALRTRKRAAPPTAQPTASTGVLPTNIGRRLWYAAPVLCGLSLIVAFAFARLGRATLEIVWEPNAQQLGSKLLVNQMAVPIAADSPTTLRIRPGRVRLRLERTGFESIDQQIRLGWGGRYSYEPHWVAEQDLVEHRLLASLEGTWKTAMTARPDDQRIRQVRSGVAEALARGVGRARRQHASRLLHAIPSEFERRLGEPTVADRPGAEWAIGDDDFHHAAAVTDLAFTTDGKLFATAGHDGCVCVYAMPDGGRTKTFFFANEIQRVAFASNTGLVIAGSNGLFVTHDLSRDERVVYAAPRASVVSLAASSRGNFLAAGFADNKLRVWRKGSKEPVKTIAFSHFVRCVAFSKDERWIAGADARGRTLVWDRVADEVHELPKGVPGGWMMFDPAGKRLTVFGANLRRADWSLDEMTAIPAPTLSGTPTVTDAAEDGSWILELPNPANRTTVRVTGVEYSRRLADFPAAAKYSPALGWVALGYRDGSVEIYSTQDDTLKHGPVEEASRWTAVAISQDGSKFALGAQDGRVQLFDAFTRQAIGGETLSEARKHSGSVQFLGFCNQDRELISFDGTSLVVAKVDDVNSHQSFRATSPVACCRESSVFCFRTKQGLVLYDLDENDDGNAQRIFPVSAERAMVAFTPDASRLAIVDGGKLQVIDVTTGERLTGKFLAADPKFSSVCFVSANRLLMTGEQTTLISLEPFRRTEHASIQTLRPIVSTHSNSYVAREESLHRLDATGNSVPLTDSLWTRRGIPLGIDVTPDEQRFIWVDGTGRVTVARLDQADGFGSP